MGLLENIIDQIKSDNTDYSKNEESLPWENDESEKQGSERSLIGKITKNPKRAATIGIVFIVLIIGCIALFNYFNKPSMIIEKDENSQANTQIQVHVAGEVISPGVYKLDNGSRVIDAINLAGGFGPNAIKDDLNLAKTLTDGEQILIKSNTSANAEASSSSSSSNSTTSSNNSSSNGKVNINTATLAELQTLNGVGPSTAQKIIDYRTSNGKFKTIEDIKKVSGIGDKTYAKFADKICV